MINKIGNGINIIEMVLYITVAVNTRFFIEMAVWLRTYRNN